MSYFDSIPQYKNHYIQAIRNKEDILVSLLFEKYIQNKLTLEVGCGNGYYSQKIQMLTQNNSYHLDSSFNLLKQGALNNKTICSDYLKNPFKKEYFEQVVCIGAVEFIGIDFFKITSEILVKNGTCLICIPKKNFFGFFYSIFYRLKNIPLCFYENTIETEILKYFTIEFSTDLMLNKYLFLQKK